MKITIDTEKCIGCGTCVSLCEEVFELDDQNKAQIKKKGDLVKNQKGIKEAKDSCPVQVISIQE